MTTHAAARQRQRRVKRALAGGGATAQLHHVPGHDLPATGSVFVAPR